MQVFSCLVTILLCRTKMNSFLGTVVVGFFLLRLLSVQNIINVVIDNISRVSILQQQLPQFIQTRAQKRRFRFGFDTLTIPSPCSIIKTQQLSFYTTSSFLAWQRRVIQPCIWGYVHFFPYHSPHTVLVVC